eukprot:TRINITY_DN16397_c0_g1_i2.p1 TRINITY_DN16397_c0_g1~~TRINITY_DN16397_c0_g1_i2.p1  ORF type:complete len:297 (+),score=32.36 TRINITY_DN16397_c0_g1_i2:64-954(+)
MCIRDRSTWDGTGEEIDTPFTIKSMNPSNPDFFIPPETDEENQRQGIYEAVTNTPRLPKPNPSDLRLTYQEEEIMYPSSMSFHQAPKKLKKFGSFEKTNAKDKMISVLVVDDNPFNIMSIERILSKCAEIRVDKAFNGLEALEKVKFKDESARESNREPMNYDVIFMDCQMPFMDGYEASSKIKELVNKGEIPPVIIIGYTAGQPEDGGERMRRSGMDDWILKPCSKDTLLEKIRNACFCECQSQRGDRFRICILFPRFISQLFDQLVITMCVYLFSLCLSLTTSYIFNNLILMIQ